MKPRQVGHRLTACWLTLGVLSVAWFEPSSLSADILDRAGYWGHTIGLALAVCAVLGIADTFVNDILPAGCCLPGLPDYRHAGFMVMSILHLSFVWAMIMAEALTWVAAQYVCLALSCIWIASFDTVYHREADHV